ncbi:hypothetical protein ACFVWN_22765 [Nocardiopsis flavescens]|uniref:DUF1273 family protein n=1 Tax=Nocardiopsis flavescens TaxID=758803 RepID=A0A1M6HAL6_9ACTN|nr:hypothetical protein [Nocardiopsis flavescens]SHJ19268.1 hypothetical protein SAMN05421803_104108 [Nocardiopsis flavescens]
MARLGITGHSDLGEETAALVRRALDRELAAFGGGPELVGVSCLARGADQVFAEAIWEARGTLEVILPAVDYREAVVAAEDLYRFDGLLMRAASVRYMPFRHADEEAYAAANTAVLARVERLIAVWDGRPGGERGGTADAVAAARRHGVPVHVVWPRGAVRG